MEAQTIQQRATNFLTKTTKDILSLKEEFVGNAIFIMILVLIIIIACYVYYMLNLDNRECSMMHSLYSNGQTKSYIAPIDYDKPEYGYTLKDYYIKTAYNCCSGGSYKNDFVSTCALQTILKQGVRCLDFEIYSIDDQPVVATSTVPNYYVKETYNSVPFASAMDTIANYGFSGSTAPNSTDPIIIHLRIKSTNQNMLTNCASIFKRYDNYMLKSHYSYEYTYVDPSLNVTNNTNSADKYFTHNLGDVKLADLAGKKIVVVVDRLNTAFMDNKDFYEYVNMTSNSMFMRALNYYDVKFTPDMNELQEYNKLNMTIAMPDSGADPENPSGPVCREMGCQLIAMRYQKFDSNLQETLMFFDEAGSAFVLKPERLRYKQQVIQETPPNPPELNFATRTTTTDYYSIQT
uniref:PI-PLC Y-box domain-containing protein n=1 Tax=viral metagenome TaxID=1070528 RepID=A0A6C0HD49_9ZZZZ